MTTRIRSLVVSAVGALLLSPVAAVALQSQVEQTQLQQLRAQQQPPKPPVDHSAHGATPQGAADDCMTAQSKVSVTGNTARDRLETARQTNDPARMRAAVDEALLAINALLAATEPCRTAPAMGGMDHTKMATPDPGAPVSPGPPAAADPHAGMIMPGTAPKSGATPVTKPADPHAGMKMPAVPTKAPAKRGARSPQKPAQSDPHAGMNMPGAQAKTPAKPAAKQAPAKPGAKPAPAADPHAGMNMAPAGGATADDPKKLTCATAVDPDNAPSTTYKGKTYYFCSAADRLRFIMNPVAYLKKGPGGK